VYLIGEPPEEDGYDDAAPELSHDVEQAETPDAEDGDGSEEAGSERGEETVGERGGVDGVAHGVEHVGEGAEEGDEGEDDGVEERLLGEHVGELGVEEHEANGHGEIDPRLEERDDLGAASLGGDDEHVLGVPQDGVVEEDAEEHEPQRHDLLQRLRFYAEELGRRGSGGISGRRGRGGGGAERREAGAERERGGEAERGGAGEVAREAECQRPVAEEVRVARRGGGEAEAVACYEAGLHGGGAGVEISRDGGDKVGRPESKARGLGKGRVLSYRVAQRWHCVITSDSDWLIARLTQLSHSSMVGRGRERR
jgi:hypothetical protein